MCKNNLVGYIRISTASQQNNSSLKEQRDILLNYGVKEENIIQDVGSGRSLEHRPNLKDFLEKNENLNSLELLKLKNSNLEEKKTFIVCYLDRISRDFDNGLSILSRLERQGFSFLPLDMPMIHSAEPAIAKLVFSLLIWLAEYEINSRQKRQKHGIFEARKRGVYNRPRKKTVLTANNIISVKEKLARNLTNIEIYRSLGISKSSFYLAKKLIAQQKDGN
jgi:DNA invertase Pin-like site-specific DNA recombinase